MKKIFRKVVVVVVFFIAAICEQGALESLLYNVSMCDTVCVMEHFLQQKPLNIACKSRKKVN